MFFTVLGITTSSFWPNSELQPCLQTPDVYEAISYSLSISCCAGLVLFVQNLFENNCCCGGHFEALLSLDFLGLEKS